MQKSNYLYNICMKERKYLIALYSFIPFGPARTKLLIKYFGGSKNAWNASVKSLLEIGLSRSVVKKFDEHRNLFDFRKYFETLKRLEIKTVTVSDKNYPRNLMDLEDAPIVVYYRGELKQSDVNSVAMVGSRKMTVYGREVAEKLAMSLASYGVTIVSGLAFGIDITSHKAALEAGGRCIAVLASSPEIITPKSNEWLGKKIIESGGAVVSEYPIGTEPQKSYFPFRNRIISGLSKAVIVVEGMEKSGTIHTASHAAKQGREVFAVPGQITSPMSGAPHFLIKNGAKMVTDVKDILEELDLQLKVDNDAMDKVLPSDKREKQIIEYLSREPMHLDELARITELKVSVISSKLTVMELKGLVKNLGGGVYRQA